MTAIILALLIFCLVLAFVALAVLTAGIAVENAQLRERCFWLELEAFGGWDDDPDPGEEAPVSASHLRVVGAAA